MKKLINYAIKIPEKDELSIGHKYPFNACQIICSDNGLNINKLLKMPLAKIIKEKKEKMKNLKDEQGKEKRNDEKEENIKIVEKENEKGNEKEIIEKENKKEKKNEQKSEENLEKQEKIEEKSEKNEIENMNEEKKDKNNNDEKDKEVEIINQINNQPNTNLQNKEEEAKAEKKEKEEIKDSNEEKDKTEEIKDITKEENKKAEEKDEIIDDNFVSSINDSGEEEKDLEKEEEEDIIDERENEKIINEELLNYLFSYLDNKSSIQNEVLSGYFNKITNFLLKKNTQIILNYLYLNKETILYKLLSNIGQDSIGNIVENILNALSEGMVTNSDNYFSEILDFLLDLISKEECSDETVEAVCQLLINSIIYNNKLKFTYFFESTFMEKIKDIIKKLYESKDKNMKKIINLIELITKINNNILINLENRITPNINLDAVKVEIINILKANDRNSFQFYTLDNNIKKNAENIIGVYKLYLKNYCVSLNEITLIIINDIISDNNIGKDKKIFGLKNIYKFEFICSVIDLCINNLQFDVEQRVFITEKINELIKTGVFNKIVDLYFIYKNNNMYSNIFSQIIQIIINGQSPKELIDNIFINSENNQDKNLINLLINDIINNLKYIYEESKNEMDSLSFAQEILILNAIFSSNNSYLKEIIEKNLSYKFFNEMLVQNVMNLFNKKLYKINDNIEQKKVDLFNPYFDAQKEQSDTNIPFSLQSFSEIISLYLLVYEKYNKNEDYKNILKENEELLEVSINLYIYNYV